MSDENPIVIIIAIIVGICVIIFVTTSSIQEHLNYTARLERIGDMLDIEIFCKINNITPRDLLESETTKKMFIKWTKENRKD